MAQLTALADFGKSSIANSGANELSVMVPVENIYYDDDFQDLFPLDEAVISKICESIKKNSYDKSQPIHVLKDTMTLIDGHNRFEAAKRCGLKEIPVYFHRFENKQDAIEYALLLQLNRRNLNDAELFEAIGFLDKLKNKGMQTADVERGKSAELLAKKIGVSRSKIEKARTIKNKGDEETIKAVSNGDISINAGYNAILKNKKENDNPIDVSINVPSDSEVEKSFSNENINDIKEDTDPFKNIETELKLLKTIGISLLNDKPVNKKIVGKNIISQIEKIETLLKEKKKWNLLP